MITSTDQFGQTYTFLKPPERIVSLVPSISEFLCEIGLQGKMVGCTKYCVHPISLRKYCTTVGGTKTPCIPDIIRLNPDIIFTNKEENRKEDVEELKKTFSVWVSDVSTLAGAASMRNEIAKLWSKNQVAEQVSSEVNTSINRLSVKSKPNTAYLIWRKPYMVAGCDTFIHHMLSELGFQNAFNLEERYPKVSIQDLLDKKLDIILLSSEPFPFQQKHVNELKMHFPTIEIRLVDGEYFSWYGSRQLHCNSFYL